MHKKQKKRNNHTCFVSVLTLFNFCDFIILKSIIVDLISKGFCIDEHFSDIFFFWAMCEGSFQLFVNSFFRVRLRFDLFNNVCIRMPVTIFPRSIFAPKKVFGMEERYKYRKKNRIYKYVWQQKSYFSVIKKFNR